MKRINYLLLAIPLTVLTAFKFKELPKDFTSAMKRTKMNFTMPKDMIEAECIKNKQMNYEYAIKSVGKNFEARYAIRPLDSLIINYEKEGKKGIHPNKYGDMSFRATLMNIAIGGPNSGMMPEVYYFDSLDVKKEYNADWGATSMIMTGPEFGGTKYKYCVALVLHKDNLGDAYVFFLSDNQEDMMKDMESSYYALKFDK